MKKKVLGMVLSTAMAVTLMAGCTSDTPAPETKTETKADTAADTAADTTEAADSTGSEAESTAAGGGKVLMTVSNQQNEFMVGMAESFLEVGEAAGYDCQLMDADLDASKQVSQIETAISQGAEAIFVEPCSADGLTSGLQAAKEAGIPVFVIHNNVSATDLITSLIHVDVKDGGRLKMEQVMKDIGGKGNIAIMTGTLGQDTTNQICSGYEEVLADYPDVNVVFEGAGNWGATDAAPLAENWLASGKEIDAIVCNNDGMALGVLPVLETAGKIGEIKVYGLDATAEGVKAVNEDKMAATIFVDARAEIVEAFRMVGDIKAGKEVESEFKVPAVLVTKDNVAEYLK